MCLPMEVVQWQEKSAGFSTATPCLLDYICIFTEPVEYSGQFWILTLNWQTLVLFARLSFLQFSVPRKVILSYDWFMKLLLTINRFVPPILKVFCRRVVRGFLVGFKQNCQDFVGLALHTFRKSFGKHGRQLTKHSGWVRTVAIWDPAACAQTMAASNNRDHARNLCYYCVLALHI